MIAAIRPVQSLLLAIFILMAGSGFLSTLIGLRLERAGAGTMAIGAVATAYFGGLVIGALRAGSIVRQVGHIRAFAAFVDDGCSYGRDGVGAGSGGRCGCDDWSVACVQGVIELSYGSPVRVAEEEAFGAADACRGL